ncbi:MAG: monovalent cation/H+ antiporter subunit D family protein [Planctomycetes bacterium]|nr:monovalent cation/H+ antiporter subunit D family protein [Planctomycetota bacterium]
MNPETTIKLALALPLAVVATTVFFGERQRNLRESFTLLGGVALFLAVALLVPAVTSGDRPATTLFEMIPGLAIAFEVEPLGMLFALVASGLWVVTTCYSIGYMRAHHEEHQTRFFTCFAIAIFAAIGAALAANMFTLFVFYEVLTLSTYPLVTHHGTEAARKGGRTYLGILLFTSVAFLLMAVVWTWMIAGTLDFRPGGILAGKADNTALCALLGLYVFGTGKAALMPFHRWLPAAMVAPTPVSALLHAVAVVKVGVFTVMKVAVYIFGIDLLKTTGISVWLMYVAGATILLASLVALTKNNLKARLAYSTISQLSYIVLGAMLANSWGVIGGSMHIAMHAFGKITLFFCAGAIYITAHKTEISDMRGIGRTMPFTTFAFLLGSLSVIGLPPFGGSWSKWYLALGATEAYQWPLVAVLMISSLLNIAYLMPIVVRGFFFAPVDGPEQPKMNEAPLLCVVPLCVTAVGSLALFFFADDVYQLLLPITLGSVP